MFTLAKVRKYLHNFLTSPVAMEDPDPQYSRGDLTDPGISGEVAARQAFSDAVTQYYWDVKMGLSEETSIMAVECPTCGAGVHAPCVAAVPGMQEWAGRLMHPERYNFMMDVHAEFCQMVGRDRA